MSSLLCEHITKPATVERFCRGARWERGSSFCIKVVKDSYIIGRCGRHEEERVLIRPEELEDTQKAASQTGLVKTSD